TDLLPLISQANYPSVGLCSKTCGGGVRAQFRVVTNRPAAGGKACPALSQTIACNTQGCPVDCVVSAWATYDVYNDYYNRINAYTDVDPLCSQANYPNIGLCSKSCGGGVRTQFRAIIVRPSNGGKACPALSQTIACNTQSCPLDCVVGQ